jgi:hypothetical protein
MAHVTTKTKKLNSNAGIIYKNSEIPFTRREAEEKYKIAMERATFWKEKIDALDKEDDNG